MASSARQRRPSAFCGKLHREAGPIFLRMLDDWERRLNYVKYRVAEWKQQASVMHPDYYSFRDFILVSVERNILTELDLLAVLLAACRSIAEGSDVPQHWCCQKLFCDFRERMGAGSVTRPLHLECWREYSAARAGEEDCEVRMEDTFDVVRTEITILEQRAKDFRGMVQELKNLVDKAQKMECVYTGGGTRDATVPGISPSRLAFLKEIEKRRPPLPGEVQASMPSAYGQPSACGYAPPNPEPCKHKGMREDKHPPKPGTPRPAFEPSPSTHSVPALDFRVRTPPRADPQEHIPTSRPSRPHNGIIRFPIMPNSTPGSPNPFLAEPVSESRTRLPPLFPASRSPPPAPPPPPPPPVSNSRRPAPPPISASRSRLPPMPRPPRFAGESRTRQLVETARAMVEAIDENIRRQDDDTNVDV